MRWPLRYQILLPFAGVLVAALVGVSVLNAYLAARRTERQIEAQLREVARTLLDSHFPLTDSVLRQTRGLSGAEFVLAGLDGRVLASSLPDGRASMPPDLESKLHADGWEQVRLGAPVQFGDERYFHEAVELLQPGAEGPAVLHILYPVHIWREARWQAVYPPLLVGAIALGVVGVLALGIAGRLSRPIAQLRQQVGRLAQGDYQSLELPARDDELRDLVSSVNSLAEQLEQLQRVIKRSERLSLLGQLSGGLAHNLRNDVTGARMAVQLHQRHCRDIDQESLTVALRQLALTEEHLQRFLAAGQPQAPRRAPCDLDKIVDELVALLEPMCDHRKVELRLTRVAGETRRLLADAEQIRHLLMNLTINAVEAAGASGWVEIEIVGLAGYIALRVRDSGPGPAAEVRERLFEAFTTSKPEGIGLGLAVARQIAEAHGGSLRLLDTERSCFEARLPRGDLQVVASAVSNASAVGAAL